jgi:soluble lytic murein transglycosylase
VLLRRGGLVLAAVAAAGLLLALVYGWWHWRREVWRRGRYDGLIYEAATRHAVSPALVKAVITRESSFRSLTRGKAGEMGLMQVMDGVVRDWQRCTGRGGFPPGLLMDPRLNIEIGTWYLARARRAWQEWQDVDALALAQYNAGRANALKWAPEDRQEKLLGRVRFPGTRRYIASVLETKRELEQEHLNREPASDDNSSPSQPAAR